MSRHDTCSSRDVSYSSRDCVRPNVLISNTHNGLRLIKAEMVVEELGMRVSAGCVRCLHELYTVNGFSIVDT